MKTIEYVKKYKPKISLNVVKTLLIEDGAEITPEIIAYLKTTPWNTNIKVLEALIGKGGSASANALTNENGIELTTENGEVIEAN